MKIIDAHIHFSKIDKFRKTADKYGIKYDFEGLNSYLKENRIETAICMGLAEGETGSFPDFNIETPMLCNKHPQIKTVCGINPYTLTKESLREIEKGLEENRFFGIKIYLGYYPLYPFDKRYFPLYKLGEKYNCPVIFHSGDTYSEKGILKYAHPLNIDEVAVKFPKTKFVVAHFGDPWIMECAEILSKNENLFADLSGLIVGDKKEIRRFKKMRLFKEHVRRGIVYLDNYDKLLYGSDWPLVDMSAYIKFIKSLIPRRYWENVFYKNAKKLFNL